MADEHPMEKFDKEDSHESASDRSIRHPATEGVDEIDLNVSPEHHAFGDDGNDETKPTTVETTDKVEGQKVLNRVEQWPTRESEFKDQSSSSSSSSSERLSNGSNTFHEIDQSKLEGMSNESSTAHHGIEETHNLDDSVNKDPDRLDAPGGPLKMTPEAENGKEEPTEIDSMEGNLVEVSPAQESSNRTEHVGRLAGPLSPLEEAPKWVNSLMLNSQEEGDTFSTRQKYSADRTRSEYLPVEGKRSPSSKKAVLAITVENDNEDWGRPNVAVVQHEGSSSSSAHVEKAEHFEKAVHEQNTHDMICPVCKSNVTKIIILKRKTGDSEPWGCLGCLSLFLRICSPGQEPLVPGAGGAGDTPDDPPNDPPEGPGEITNWNCLPKLPAFSWGPIPVYDVPYSYSVDTDTFVESQPGETGSCNCFPELPPASWIEIPGVDGTYLRPISGNDNSTCSCLPVGLPFIHWRQTPIYEQEPLVPGAGGAGDHQSSGASSSWGDNAYRPPIGEPGRGVGNTDPLLPRPPNVVIMDKPPPNVPVTVTVTVPGPIIVDVPSEVIGTVNVIASPGTSQEYLKSVVHGGLDVTLVSLGVVASGAGGDAKTITVLGIGLANLVFGLITHLGTIMSLYYHDQPKFVEDIGQGFVNGCLSCISFLFFGALAPITYGFSFRNATNRDYKFASTCVVAFVCIVLLGAAQAHVKSKSAVRVISLLIVTGFGAVTVGFDTGKYVGQLLKYFGFDSV